LALQVLPLLLLPPTEELELDGGGADELELGSDELELEAKELELSSFRVKKAVTVVLPFTVMDVDVELALAIVLLPPSTIHIKNVYPLAGLATMLTTVPHGTSFNRGVLYPMYG